MSVYERLAEQGWELPPFVFPKGSFVPAVLHNGILTVSGRVSDGAGPWACSGKVGREATLEQGYLGARQALLNSLASIESVLGDLNRVTRFVRLAGYVNSVPEFDNPGGVIDGASDAILTLFGDRGQHARTSIGVATLPRNATVEIDLVLVVD